MKITSIIDCLKEANIKYNAIKLNNQIEIDGYSSLFNYKEGSMTFIVPERKFGDYKNQFKKNSIALMIMSDHEEECDMFQNAIVVEDPRKVFFYLIEELFMVSNGEEITGITSNPNVYRKNSFVSESAQIGKNVKIGVGCVIEGNVVIGDDTEIHHNVVIRNKTKIGKRCMIHSGVVIGEYGFGYTLDTITGKKNMLKHYGGVTIEDDVHIGDNTCIIRGAIDDTIIHEGVKINTMVHIAHNDVIGRNTMITSPVHICGSVNVGENCHVAGVTIRNQRNIGNNVTIGLGTVVVSDIGDNLTVVGNPAHALIKN